MTDLTDFLSGFLLLAIVCVNYLTCIHNLASIGNIKLPLHLNYKLQLFLKIAFFISVRSVRFDYGEKPDYLFVLLLFEAFKIIGCVVGQGNPNWLCPATYAPIMDPCGSSWFEFTHSLVVQECSESVSFTMCHCVIVKKVILTGVQGLWHGFYQDITGQ